MNFYCQLRERPEEQVRLFELTKWSRHEHELSMICVLPDQPLEDARRLYFHLWSSIRPFSGNASWRRQKFISRKANGTGPMNSAAQTFMRTKHLLDYAERLCGVQFETVDAIEVIADYDHPEAVFYVDPPYVLSSRANSSPTKYSNEYEDWQHEELLCKLNHVESMVILSGYYSEIYSQHLSNGWHCIEFAARMDGGGSAVEVLWLNDAVFSRLEAEAAAQKQLSLFEVTA